jgi:hypothetical protein
MAAILALVLAASGLHGVVMRGPTQPVCQVGQPCSAPAVGVKLAFWRRGVAVARVRTGARGAYVVRLRPGIYTVHVTPAPPLGRGIEPVRVNVVRGVIGRVNFFIDTGIR